MLDAMTATMATCMNRQLKSARVHLQALSSSPGLQSPMGYLQQRRKALQMLSNQLYANQSHQISLKKQRFIGCTSKLDALSPLKVLTRGYAMTQRKDGEVIRSIGQVNVHDRISVMLGDGSMTAEVLEVKENMQ
jgi:exodeoxyribonuclease VII large subunit